MNGTVDRETTKVRIFGVFAVSFRPRELFQAAGLLDDI
jgi:hypothetical protein